MVTEDKPDKSRIQGAIDKLEIESNAAMKEALKYKKLYDDIQDELSKLHKDLNKAK